MPVLDQITEAQERFFEGVETANERILDTVTATVDTVSTRMPEFTARIPEVPFAEQLTNRLPKLPFADRIPTPDLSFVDDLPKPLELVDAYFDFVARGVEINRDFTGKMIAAVTPVEAEKPSPKKTTSKKATTKKASAKKSTSKKVTAKKSTAKKPAAKKVSAKK